MSCDHDGGHAHGEAHKHEHEGHVHDSPSEFEGIYDFTHVGGTFDVLLRPGGRFFAPMFQAKATWRITPDQRLLIDWAKFGKYDLALTAKSPPAFDGSAVGQPDNWRKMKLREPFSTAELKLMDSRWDFQWSGGSFEVEFRADAHNHFICKSFPDHSHWTKTGSTVYINWGKYGEYELELDPSGDYMSGSVKGKPDDWRKATRFATGHAFVLCACIRLSPACTPPTYAQSRANQKGLLGSRLAC